MKDYKVSAGWNEVVLPVGSFVKPLELTYLPQHIKDGNDYRWYTPSKEVFVYCHYGIVLLPRDLIRRIT